MFSDFIAYLSACQICPALSAGGSGEFCYCSRPYTFEYLFTFVENMSDVYLSMTDGFLPRLRSLCVHVSELIENAMP